LIPHMEHFRIMRQHIQDARQTERTISQIRVRSRRPCFFRRRRTIGLCHRNWNASAALLPRAPAGRRIDAVGI
jgi:hypothetical protein